MPRISRQQTALALAVLLAGTPRLTLAATPTSFTGPDQGLWNVAGNWSAGIPNSTSFDALIAPAAPLTVQLNVNETINNLTLNSPGTLTLLSTLTLAGTNLTNTGTLLFNATASNPTLFFSASPTFSGGGIILMTNTASKLTGGGRLTSDNLISGTGNISNLALTNSGTITATAATLTLTPSGVANSVINTGTLRADGGELHLLPNSPPSVSFDNTGGIIEALANSDVSFASSAGSPDFFSLTGGTIRGLSGGFVDLGISTFQNASLAGDIRVTSGAVNASKATLINSTASALITIASKALLQVSNILNNTGTISLAGTLNASNGTLTGGGSMLMTGVLTSTSSLTSNNAITGSGTIGSTNFNGSLFKFTNSGSVTATSGSLLIGVGNASGSFFNTGILRADGGTLNLLSTLNNTGGTIEAINNSTVIAPASVVVNNVETPGITGGTIRAANGGTITINSAVNTIFDLSDPTGVISFVNGSVTSYIANATINVDYHLTGLGGSETEIRGLNVNGSLTLSKIALGVGTITGTGSLSGIIFLSGKGPLVIDVPLYGDLSLLAGAGTITNNNHILLNGPNGFVSPSTAPITKIINNGIIQSEGAPINFNSTIDNSTGIIILHNGASLALFGTLNGGTLDMSSTSILYSPFSYAGLSNVTFASNPASIGASFNLSGTIAFGGVLPIGSSACNDVTFVGGGTLSLGQNVNFTGSKLTTFNAIRGIGSIDVATFINNNIVEAANNGILFISRSNRNITNNGTFSANAATLSLNGNFTGGYYQSINNGVIQIGASSPTFITNATLSTDSGGTFLLSTNTTLNNIENRGIITLKTGTNLTCSGTLTNNGTFSANAATLILSGNFAGGSYQSINKGLLQFVANAFVSNETFSTATGGTILLNPCAINGIENRGTLTLNGTSILSGTLTNNGLIQNGELQAGALAILNGSGTVTTGTISGNFTNAGTLNVATPYPQTSFSIKPGTNPAMPTINLGIIHVEGGSIPDSVAKTYFSPYASNGVLQVAGGFLDNSAGTIEANNANITFTNTVLTGGTLSASLFSAITFASGTVNLSSPIFLNGQATLTPPAFPDPTVYFNSTSPNSQNVASITGTGYGGQVIIGSGALLTSDGITAGLGISTNGKLIIRKNGADSGTSGLILSLAGNQNNWTSTLDINDNKLILLTSLFTTSTYYKTTTIARAANQLLSGYHNGDWQGTGITSSTVAADAAPAGTHSLTLALFDNADLNLSSFGGQPVDSNSLLITTALIADTNLDNQVDAADFQNWYAHKLQLSPLTENGDFNHDGIIDGQDFDLWYAADPTAQATLDSLGLNRTDLSNLRAVPEPSSLLLLALPTLLRRPRQSRRKPH